MFSPKKLRRYLAIVAVTMWTVWLVDMSGPGPLDRLGKVKGTDFLHFYVMGSIAREGRWESALRRRGARGPGAGGCARLG